MRFTTFVARLGVKLAPAQRVLALVAFDGVEPDQLEGEDRELALKLFGPVDVIPPVARGVLVAVCGARGGKTYVIGALYSLWRAFTADLSTLAPGELAVALIVAPDVRLARQCLRYALGAVKESHQLVGALKSESADSFVLQQEQGQVAIEVLPATRGGGAVRGRSLVSAVLDEAAFFRDETAVVNDADVFRAVAPRVMPGGMVVIASTPWLEAGLLYEEQSKNFGEPKTAIAAHAPTTLLRPDARTISMVERERERDADNAAREFDALFIAGGAGVFFGRALLEPAIAHDLAPRLSAAPGVVVAVGGDLGLVKDASAFVAVHRESDELVLANILEMRPERGKPLKLSNVVEKGCDFAKAHSRRVIHVDHHELQAAREHLPDGYHLQPVTNGQDAKAERYLKLRELLRQGKLRIPATFTRVIAQLGDVVARPTPGGGLQITITRRNGVHGDLVSALVNAVWIASISSRLEAGWAARTAERVTKRAAAGGLGGY